MTAAETGWVSAGSGANSATSATRAWLRALQATGPISKQPNRILPIVIDEIAKCQGLAPALLSERDPLTYGALAERANRYARWALAHGIAKGAAVALLMPNRPDYFALWLGMTHVGVTVALLNSNLVGATLAHCIDCARPIHIIVAIELLAAFDSARPFLAADAKVWLHGGSGNYPNLDREVDQLSGGCLTHSEERGVGIEDRALLIYTSGTVGLPKAAVVSHCRLMLWSYWFAGMMDTGPGDRMYDCLPMYHSVGGVVAIGAVLVRGGSVVIREKFSTRHFWDDVTRHGCTLFQYIGEICRYLVNSPSHPCERDHGIRLCCGNGLGADVWQQFQRRFQVPRILEFYAASEGNFSLYNVEGEPGVIGRIPRFLAHRWGVSLVKLDVETGAPHRGANGMCVQCAAGEVGEAVGRILSRTGDVGRNFEGYMEAQESENRILRDVFAPGDSWFRSGDLMYRDQRGFFRFVDRIGDSFRWKGENVASSEVGQILTRYPGILEACVYGVVVPGADGRAGMAAITTDELFNLGGLRDHLAQHLPQYAHPVFLRLGQTIAVTATYKYRKSELAAQGFDPTLSGDAYYFLNPRRKTFVPLDELCHERIEKGQMRL